MSESDMNFFKTLGVIGCVMLAMIAYNLSAIAKNTRKFSVRDPVAVTGMLRVENASGEFKVSK